MQTIAEKLREEGIKIGEKNMQTLAQQLKKEGIKETAKRMLLDNISIEKVVINFAWHFFNFNKTFFDTMCMCVMLVNLIGGTAHGSGGDSPTMLKCQGDRYQVF